MVSFESINSSPLLRTLSLFRKMQAWALQCNFFTTIYNKASVFCEYYVYYHYRTSTESRTPWDIPHVSGIRFF